MDARPLRVDLALPAVLVAVALSAGCSGADPAAGRPGAAASVGSEAGPDVVVSLPPPAPGVRMSFAQQRVWEGTRRADLRVVNITDRPLEVRRVALRWPGYPARPQAAAALVPAGGTLDLRYRLPDPDCDADPATPATGVAETARRTVRRRLDEAGHRFLRRIWAADCARRRVDGLVDLDYGVPAEPRVAGRAGGRLEVLLHLARREGRGPRVLVREVAGTVLFDLRLAAGLPAGLAPGRSTAAVPLVVDPGRCDEHARSQASQPFAFRLWLRVGSGAEPVSVVAVPDGVARRRLLAFLDAACAGVTAH